MPLGAMVVSITVVTLLSLEPMTSRMRSEDDNHYTKGSDPNMREHQLHYIPPPFFFLESLAFSSTRHHRLLPNSPIRQANPIGH